jgi:uncharacterized protein (DUF885 family)
MIIDRRQLLAGVAAVGLTPALAQAKGPTSPEDVKLDSLLTRQFNDAVDESPETATSLGLDKGARSALRFKLNDRSVARIDQERSRLKARAGALAGIDRARLSRSFALSFDVAQFRLTNAAAAAERFHYGPAGGHAAPYIVTQLSGAYASVPEFLVNEHRIETRSDVDAYLARVQAFADALDQENEVIRHDAALGVAPPDFILDAAIANLQILRLTPMADNALATNLAKKTRSKGLGGVAKTLEALISGPVAEALDRQIVTLQALRAKAVHDAGVWRLPDGAALYEAGLLSNTTLKITGEEVHALGLAQVGELQARLDSLLASQGLTQGTVGARIAALNADPAQLYPNTDAAKTELVGHLNELVADMRQRLPQIFDVVPKAGLEIRRVPGFIEGGAPLGYYNAAPLDGSRPAAYYINLKDTADWPRWALPTLSYHEGIPGHHLQISVSREAGDLPIYRRVGGFPGYTEGWALYAEQLADEIGVYANDPLGHIGYLQSLLFRAVRLVVDSGVHVKRWSREQGVRYIMETCGRTEGASINEVERYCVWPGQACSYKLGHTVITRLREDAKARLGDRFDLKRFHDAVLLDGALPLPVLETVIAGWIAKG